MNMLELVRYLLRAEFVGVVHRRRAKEKSTNLTVAIRKAQNLQLKVQQGKEFEELSQYPNTCSPRLRRTGLDKREGRLVHKNRHYSETPDLRDLQLWVKVRKPVISGLQPDMAISELDQLWRTIDRLFTPPLGEHLGKHGRQKSISLG